MLMEFALLASGSKGNSFLLRDEGTDILLDCGSTKKYLFSCLSKLNERLDDLDALLITHDHSDHVSQIRFFKDLTIYAPVYLPDIDSFLVKPDTPFTIGNLRILPIALSHDAPHTVGYIFADGTEKLVYITDTGYVNQRYFPLLQGADYIVMEANHDVQMLMHTNRPQYLKARIYGDDGHLNNEDCAEVLSAIVSPNTRMIVLAHISQEANTRELALQVCGDRLLRDHKDLNPQLLMAAAGQFEMIRKGKNDEEMDPGSVYRLLGMEHYSERTDQ